MVDHRTPFGIVVPLTYQETPKPTMTVNAAVFILLLLLHVSVTTGEDVKEDPIEYLLPFVEVQFICPENIRSTFNATKTLEDFYGKHHSMATKVSIKTKVQSSDMNELPADQFDEYLCPFSPYKVLFTIQSEGTARTSPQYAQVSQEDFTLHALTVITPSLLRQEFEYYVCPWMYGFHAVVSDPVNEGVPLLHHNATKLCDQPTYYDYDGEASFGFVVLAVAVGFVMITSIGSELQKLQNRPHPTGRRTQEREEYTEAVQEIELV